MSDNDFSVIIPAKNESKSIGGILASLNSMFPGAEIIVVDDGSSDSTANQAVEAGAIVISHPESLGNGAAIKAGARAAKHEILIFMDGDGQHDPAEIPRLLARFNEGYKMVVAARSYGSQASVYRLFANGAYNILASMITGRRIPDLTSGFRVVDAALFRKFLYLLPNGFSYPTTITMAFMRAGYPVSFVDFVALQRKGKSHIRPISDGIRFLLIIFKIATLYSPLKLFLPCAALFFSTGLGYYLYTLLTAGRFTNMSLLLLSASVIIFLIGLISEQITALMYRDQ
jgi:glycosyltransferase involved in cell wall biosynthesis